MEENIEVKDVQRTEYLDKNGLDMLWTKVKENTHNQVEVEYNRAKAKEDSLSQEIASVKPAEGKSYIQAKLTSKEQDGDSCSYDVAGDISFKSEYSDSYSGPITKINKNGIDINFDNDPTFGSTGSLKVKMNNDYNITMQGNGRLLHDTKDTFNQVSISLLDNVDTTYANSSSGNSMLISQLGIFYTSQGYALTSNDLLTGHGDYKTIGTDIAPLENGKVPEEYLDLSQYAKKTDISEVDTSDFVSKTATDPQVINSILSVTGGGIQVFQGTVDDTNEGAALIPTKLEFGYANNRSTIILRGSEVDGQNGSNITIKTNLENPYIKLSDGIDYDHIGGDTLTITNEGISNTDNNANHVYATDGSIADLTQYAKKSEITAGGNVGDVQVNGASVVENKVANIKPATKEKLGVVKVGDGLNITDGTISVAPDYIIDMMSYGIEWDTTVADPACTRIGNMSYHKSLPIQSEYKGCLVKDGAVNYYLDPNDWSKKADGTPSVLDGTDGDVMVHIPKFYGKSGSNGNKRWVRIATTKIDSSWVEIPEMFVSAYRITTYTDADKTKIASVVNTTTNYRGGRNPAFSSMYDQYLNSDKFRTCLGKPRIDVDVKEMRANANNSGQELLCYEFYKWVFYWAYVIEYANFNSLKEFNSELTSDGYHQGGLGIGVNWGYKSWKDYSSSSPITPCGYTNEFGNFSGVKQILIPQTETDDLTIYETTLQANRWRGFENPFGDIVTFLDGIILDNGSANQGRKVYTTSDSSKFGDDISVMNIIGTFVGESGTIKEFDLGETGEIIPQSVDDTISYSSYKCGYSYGCAFKGNLAVIVGGRAGGDFMSGLCSFRPFNGGTDGCGFRSVVLVH